jgi:hypothetical protein
MTTMKQKGGVEKLSTRLRGINFRSKVRPLGPPRYPPCGYLKSPSPGGTRTTAQSGPGRFCKRFAERHWRRATRQLPRGGTCKGVALWRFYQLPGMLSVWGEIVDLSARIISPTRMSVCRRESVISIWLDVGKTRNESRNASG